MQDIQAETFDPLVNDGHDIMTYNGFMLLATLCLRLKEGHEARVLCTEILFAALRVEMLGVPVLPCRRHSLDESCMQPVAEFPEQFSSQQKCRQPLGRHQQLRRPRLALQEGLAIWHVRAREECRLRGPGGEAREC